MADQVVGTKGIDADSHGSVYASDEPKLHGSLIIAVRVDDLPANEAERLAGEGKFYPLIVNERGCLWTALDPDSLTELQQSVDDLRSLIRELIDVQREALALLLKIA